MSEKPASPRSDEAGQFLTWWSEYQKKMKSAFKRNEAANTRVPGKPRFGLVGLKVSNEDIELQLSGITAGCFV